MISVDSVQVAALPAGGTAESSAARVFAARVLAARVLGTVRERMLTFARLAVALLLFPHGAQHALGWFGGYGFHGTHGWMTKTLGFPAPAAALAIITEILAPLALVVGLGGRLAGQEGFEYHLSMIALGLVIVVKGSGAWSLDRRLSARLGA